MTTSEPPKGKEDRDFQAAMRQLSPLFGAGIQLAAAVVLMFFAGQWLDTRWHTAPWLMLAGITVGIAAGFYQFFKSVHDVTANERQNRERPK